MPAQPRTSAQPRAVVQPGAGVIAAGHAAQVGVPRLRLTRRGRLVLTLLATVPCSVAGVMLASTVGAAATGAVDEVAPASSAVASTSSLAIEAGDYVQVEAGDSLWSIAESSVAGVDPREVVEDLIDMNGLAGYDLYPGQRLLIPTGY